ncbi:hypothetical protein E2C01_069609 [Portunus trituberculatus]|uniref:Uncharacterized protein n=1 Tax=Portunus trituberculatus TaxID=210409 RepID=A0A5B7HZD0_PORTR|nr:hypothetical protein [Portunus trituberculatus]
MSRQGPTKKKEERSSTLTNATRNLLQERLIRLDGSSVTPIQSDMYWRLDYQTEARDTKAQEQSDFYPPELPNQIPGNHIT